jgi:ABC-type phosphate transport system substrate-binding protein
MRPKTIPVLLLAVLVNLVLAAAAKAQNGDVAVVVNPENPVSNISLVDLRKIFAGEKQSWQGGLPIRPIVRNPGSHERLVLLRTLRMSEAEYRQHWTAQVLRGDSSNEPPSVPSVGMQKEALVVFRGAITLIDLSDVKPGMKILKVDGHLPGEPGYPVH